MTRVDNYQSSNGMGTKIHLLLREFEVFYNKIFFSNVNSIGQITRNGITGSVVHEIRMSKRGPQSVHCKM